MYNAMKMADSNFGVDHQAMAVVSFLEGMEPDFAEYEHNSYQITIHTRTWENGREHGVCLIFDHPTKKVKPLIVVCTTGRNHDGIVIYNWLEKMTDRFNNVVTVADLEDDIYEKAKTFSYGEIGSAANFIYELAAVWYGESTNEN